MPVRSVQSLALKWASFDAKGITVRKETAAFDKPFVRKSAFVEIENFPY